MSSRDDINQEKEISEKNEKNSAKDEEKTKKENNSNKEEKEKLIDFKKIDKSILELKKPKSTDFFLLKKKRLLELNSLSFHSLDSKKNRTNLPNNNYFKSNNKNSETNNINEEENIDYDSFNQSIDYIEEEHTNILEELFIVVQNSDNEKENKIN